MMCKTHPFESGVGVCAICLRQRLFALTETVSGSTEIATEEVISPEHQPSSKPSSTTHTPSPPSLGHFPRSVSPYVPRAGTTRRSFVLSTVFSRRRRGDDRDTKPQQSTTTSWLSTLLHGRWRKKKMSRMFSANDDAAAAGRDRGMSPESGCYADSSPSWLPRRPKPSPMRGVTAEHKHHHGALAGFAVCFSPLTMASPSRWRSRVAGIGLS
ncbi:hypothetical protein Cni_G14859 [Canna indica]|uniref:Uncharacterized protein n=1 Tax=Canna indica TaxID=4628 RepID=A0AAQ3KCY6_9LILI|nr:hypothetical protein Cni_G14859 [Canna indica]